MRKDATFQVFAKRLSDAGRRRGVVALAADQHLPEASLPLPTPILLLKLFCLTAIRQIAESRRRNCRPNHHGCATTAA